MTKQDERLAVYIDIGQGAVNIEFLEEIHDGFEIIWYL